MKSVTLKVESISSVSDSAKQAFNGKTQGEWISFASTDLLWKVLAPNCTAIIKVLTGSEPLALSEIARRVGRNVKSIQADVQLLLNAGVIDKNEASQLVFGYDCIRVDFLIN